MRVNRSEENISRLRKMSIRMRKMALDMSLSAGSKGAHIGGGFSVMEIMAVLYGEVLKIDSKNPLASERDRLLISKNHCTIAHFPALVETGYIKEDELSSYVTDGSRLIGYQYNPEIGLEYSGGSLGMAISVGVGQAISAKKKKLDYRVYVLMGDGELNEGSIWEAFMSIKHFELNNLIVIIDRNHLCYDGNTEEVMQLGDLPAKMRAFGFNTIECNGHDIADGKNFVVMYGAAEATSRMGYLPPERAVEKKGSMGIPIPGGKYSLIDEAGNLINTPFTTGELVYEGKNVTLGYAEKGEDLSLGDERHGRLETGDMAQFDNDGFYYVVGRKKRFLKIYGNRVNLDEIDRLIKGNFNIIDVASAGVDDHLYIFLTEPDAPFAEDVKGFVSRKTKLNPVAFNVIIVPEIPKNDSGKTLYKELTKYYDNKA